MGTLADKFATMDAEKRRYTLDTLPHHLKEAGQVQRYEDLLATFDFLKAKVTEIGTRRLIDDYADAHNGDLLLIRSALSLIEHIVTSRPPELAGQLLARLMAVRAEHPSVNALLADAECWAEGPWLRPLRACLAMPGGPLQRVLEGHTSAILHLAVSPDGQTLVSMASDGTLRGWDLATGEELFRREHRLLERRDSSCAMTFTSDSAYLVYASSAEEIEVFHLKQQQPVWKFSGMPPIQCLDDGDRVITHTRQGPVMWSLRQQARIKTVRGGKFVTAMASGAVVVSAYTQINQEHAVKRLNLMTGIDTHTTIEGALAPLTMVAASSDCRRVLMKPRSKSASEHLTLWDLQSVRLLLDLKAHIRDLDMITLSPHGDILAGITRNHIVGFFDIAGLVTGEARGWQPLGRAEHKVRTANISADSRYLALEDDSSALSVWDLSTNSIVLQLPNCIHSKFCPDETSIVLTVQRPGAYRKASGEMGESYVTQLWHLPTGSHVRDLAESTDPIRELTISPDGGWVAAFSTTGRLTISDIDTSTLVKQMTLQNFDPAQKKLYPSVFLPTMHRYKAPDGTMWDLATGEPLFLLNGKVLGFSTDGSRVVLATSRWAYGVPGPLTETMGGTLLELCDANTGASLLKVLGEPIGISQNDESLIYLPQDQTYVIQHEEGAFRRTLIQGEEPAFLTADGTRLLVNHLLSTAVYDTVSGEAVREFRGRTLDIGSGGQALCALGISEHQDGLVVVDYETGEQLYEMEGHPRRIEQGLIAPNGSFAISKVGERGGAEQHLVRTWDLHQAVPLSALLHGTQVTAWAISPDSHLVITGAWDGVIRIWNPRAFQRNDLLPTHDKVSSVVFSGDGEQVITSSLDKVKKVWAAPTGGEVPLNGELDDLEPPAKRQVEIGDRSLRAAVLEGFKIELVDQASERQLGVLKGHKGNVNVLRWLPESGVLLSASNDGSIRLWDVERCASLAHFPVHQDFINDVAVLPGERFVVSISGSAQRMTEYSAKIIDLMEGHVVAAFTADTPLHTCAASPDGRYLVAAAQNELFFFSVEMLDTDAAPLQILAGGDQGEVRPMAQSACFYPNSWGRVYLEGVEDTLGFNQLSGMLNQAGLKHFAGSYPPENSEREFPIEVFSQLHSVYEAGFGDRGARVGLMRAGTSSFNRWLKLSEIMPIRLMVEGLPPEMRPFAMLSALRGALEAIDPGHVTLQDTGTHWVWQSTRNPGCWGARARQPRGGFMVGMLLEALKWATNGDAYRVSEVQCVGQGHDACHISIEKQPVK